MNIKTNEKKDKIMKKRRNINYKILKLKNYNLAESRYRKNLNSLKYKCRIKIKNNKYHIGI